jgi:hypothetical protein
MTSGPGASGVAFGFGGAESRALAALSTILLERRRCLDRRSAAVPRLDRLRAGL